MWPFIKKGIKKFNVFIEGTYQDEWKRLNYKMAQIKVPKNTTVLNDGIYKYKLYGKTDNFEDIQKADEGVENLETKIDSLGVCKGIVLQHGGLLPHLERPRAVCMRDGRLYVDEHMIKDKAYVGSIQKILKKAGEIF